MTKAKKKKDKKELKPTMVEKLDIVSPDIDLKDDQFIRIDKSEGTDEADNFLRAVVNNLMSAENISLKTEYLNPNENFAGAKLEFLSKYGNMPYLADFIKILEIKRVSLNRKSRIELIKAFEKRDEEIQAQNRLATLKNFMGMG